MFYFCSICLNKCFTRFAVRLRSGNLRCDIAAIFATATRVRNEYVASLEWKINSRPISSTQSRPGNVVRDFSKRERVITTFFRETSYFSSLGENAGGNGALFREAVRVFFGGRVRSFFSYATKTWDVLKKS